MSEQLQEAYLINQDEWCMLIQAAGCRQYIGFDFTPEKLSEEDMVRVLCQMAKKGFITSDGDSFQIGKELSEILETVKQARKLLIVSDDQGSIPTYCCYMGKKIAVSEWMTRRKRSMRWMLREREELFDMLADEGYLAEELDVRFSIMDGETDSETESLHICRQETRRVMQYQTPFFQETLPYSEESAKIMINRLITDTKEQPEWRCL